MAFEASLARPNLREGFRSAMRRHAFACHSGCDLIVTAQRARQADSRYGISRRSRALRLYSVLQGNPSKQAGNQMSVNKVILVGRLGRDPETRFTGGGQAVANFSLATDETYKDKNGERQKRTEWHKITVWGKQAEIAQQYLKKGSLVYVEGRIQTREWQDKEGQKRTSYDIVANNFRMLGGRADGAAAGASAGASAHSGGFGGGRSADPEMEGAPAGDESAGHGPEISDEDIPF
jgi:single-strand DNA-binding protein